MKNHLNERFWNTKTPRAVLQIDANCECEHGMPDKPLYWLYAPDFHGGIAGLRNFNPSQTEPAPHPIQTAFAEDLFRLLNKEVAHDGFWVVGWTHPPVQSSIILVEADNVWKRLVMHFFDKTGKQQIVAESDKPVVEILQNGIQNYASLAEQAWMSLDQNFTGRSALKNMGVSSGTLH